VGNLYSLDSPISALPVGGFRPPGLRQHRAAAVLIGIIDRPEPEVILTLRSRRLQHHAGQVAFPGGARDPVDRSVIDTALREANEEIGVAPELVQPAGFLGRYDTITGFRITALVAAVAASAQPTPDQSEIEHVFTVPLAHVGDPRSYQREYVEHAGNRFEILTLQHPEHHIWGATAALLHELGQLLR